MHHTELSQVSQIASLGAVESFTSDKLACIHRETIYGSDQISQMTRSQTNLGTDGTRTVQCARKWTGKLSPDSPPHLSYDVIKHGGEHCTRAVGTMRTAAPGGG